MAMKRNLRSTVPTIKAKTPIRLLIGGPIEYRLTLFGAITPLDRVKTPFYRLPKWMTQCSTIAYPPFGKLK